MPTPLHEHDRLLRVRGTVQGVGFRPFVARLANELGIRGWVRNDAHGVLVRAIGDEPRLAALASRIAGQAPAAAFVTSVEWSAPAPDTPGAEPSFAIIDSAAPGAEVQTNVPVDLAPCPECREELARPADRRHGYPFINCTQCGPRYSIIESLPYDRTRTTMRAFRMCPACQREYGDPADRRFHAEPNACPVCGPQLRLISPSGEILSHGNEALVRAVATLRSGGIVAVKGVGGFHLMVDAANEPAVVELRRRKHREEKPLAVMFASLAMLDRWAEVSPAAARQLESPQAPIVLVPRRADAGIAASVAPGNPWIGALLPSSPLHLRLLAALDRPVVATSANLSDEPLCTDDDEARERLTGIADLYLGHDRRIARPVDDSVLRFTAGGEPILLRRARGFAPAPLTLPGVLPQPLLCVGAHMKNTIAVAAGARVVLSPHIGDLGGSATHSVFLRTIETLGSLFGARFGAVACDKHPDYASTRHAHSLGLPCKPVQHHLAHVLAVLLEQGEPAGDVLGVAWDGTGYGEDGTIWGGEFIHLHGGRARRFARLRPFRLPGGEAAVRDTRRVAFSLAATTDSHAGLGGRLGFSEHEQAILQTMVVRGLNSPVCSSIGRLFDGFGAILGLGGCNRFEGQIPLNVEIAATQATDTSRRLDFPIVPCASGADWEVDWQPALDAVLASRNPDPANTAAALHRGLAAAITAAASHCGAHTVVLSGGCFQNALLREWAETELVAAGFRVLAPRSLPANDGAIAAGQALAALWNLTDVELPHVNVTAA